MEVSKPDQLSLSSRLRYYLPIFVLGLAPRLVLGLVFLEYPIGLDDMLQYDMLGRSLATGNGYRWYGRQDVDRLRPYLDQVYRIELPTQAVPVDGFATAHRPPGYPFFLAGVYMLAGLERRIPAVRLAQALLGSLLGPLSAALALRFGLSRAPARLAGLAVAAYPILWMYPIGLGSENLFMPLTLAALLALLDAPSRASRLPAVVAGLFVGAATLTRGVMAAFVPIGAAWIWRRAGRGWTIWFLAAAAAVTLPWAVRNSLLLGRPAFVEASLGYNMFIGYHPDGDGRFHVDYAVIPLQHLDDAEREAWSLKQALGFIQRDPWQLPRRALARLAYFWGLEHREMIYFYSNNYFGPIPQPWLGLAYLALVSPLVILAGSAPFGLASSQAHRGLILGLIGALSLPYLLVLAEPRFHLPLVPILAVFAARAWTTPGMIDRLASGLRLRQAPWVCAMAACAALIALWIWGAWRDWPVLSRVLAPGGHQLWLPY